MKDIGRDYEIKKDVLVKEEVNLWEISGDYLLPMIQNIEQTTELFLLLKEKGLMANSLREIAENAARQFVLKFNANKFQESLEFENSGVLAFSLSTRLNSFFLSPREAFGSPEPSPELQKAQLEPSLSPEMELSVNVNRREELFPGDVFNPASVVFRRPSEKILTESLLELLKKERQRVSVGVKVTKEKAGGWVDGILEGLDDILLFPEPRLGLVRTRGTALPSHARIDIDRESRFRAAMRFSKDTLTVRLSSAVYEVSGMTIWLLDEKGKVLQSVETDNEGKVCFRNLKAAKYSVIVGVPREMS